MTPITLEDVNRYITIIRANYNDAYNLDKKTMIALYSSWFEMLKEYPKEIVDVAVLNAIKNFDYGKYPKINDVIKEIEKMRVAHEKSESELWAELTGVLREVEKCAYSFRYTFRDESGLTQGEIARIRVQEIFDGLPAELKEYVRNINGLISIAKLTSEELTYERGRFMRIIPQVKERARIRQETPESITIMLQGLTDKFTLGIGENKRLN